MEEEICMRAERLAIYTRASDHFGTYMQDFQISVMQWTPLANVFGLRDVSARILKKKKKSGKLLSYLYWPKSPSQFSILHKNTMHWNVEVGNE